ncbi:MAG: EpsG family protein [Bacteroidaceae bacterium]|nr:EpsG family protein [Bacteroidaceae bacterium]
MLVQFLILCFVYIYYNSLSATYCNNSPIGRKKLLIFAGVLLVLQSSLRNFAVGADTYAYYEFFQDTTSRTWDELIYIFQHAYVDEYRKDPGYLIFEKAFSCVIPDFRCFLILVISMFIHALFRLIYRFKVPMKGILISVALYLSLFYSFFSITGIRQTIATAIALYCVPYALDRKKIKFFLIIGIAATIHKSVLLFIPFYFFPLIKNNKLTILLAFATFAPMWVFGQTIGKTIIAGTIFDTYENFLEDNVDTNGALGFTALILLIGFFCLKFIKVTKELDKWRPLLHAVAFSLFYTPMTSIGPSQMRIIQYYSIFLVILMPILLTTLRNTLKISMNIEMYAFLFFSIYAVSRGSSYGFFWEPMKLGVSYFSNAVIQGW